MRVIYLSKEWKEERLWQREMVIIKRSLKRSPSNLSFILASVLCSPLTSSLYLSLPSFLWQWSLTPSHPYFFLTSFHVTFFCYLLSLYFFHLLFLVYHRMGHLICVTKPYQFTRPWRIRYIISDKKKYDKENNLQEIKAGYSTLK